jgi:hypothetical protein
MGEAKQRSRSRAALLAEHPRCIYCGGVRQATTIDHMPPRIMFRSKLRPGQFEFPSCDPCNQGTKTADQFAALLGRAMPNSTSREEQAEFVKILNGLKNNIRPALDEMKLVGPVEEQLLMLRTAAHRDAGFVNLTGPNTQRHFECFRLQARTGNALGSNQATCAA